MESKKVKQMNKHRKIEMSHRFKEQTGGCQKDGFRETIEIGEGN